MALEVQESPAAAERTTERLRLKLSITVHPRTIDMIDELAARLRTTRGRLIDRLVTVLHASYGDGVVRCVHGQICQINRRDMPEVM